MSGIVLLTGGSGFLGRRIADSLRTRGYEVIAPGRPRFDLMDRASVDRAITTVLASFGIEEDDRREMRADFQHLRRWRKSVEQAQGFTFKAVITVIVAGFLGAVWLGVKVTLGK